MDAAPAPRGAPVMRAWCLAAITVAGAGATALALGASASGRPSRVAVSDAAFAPRETVVAPGTRVTWTNTGPRNAHTVTADDGAFDSGAIGIGGTWTWTAPPRPAVLTYHCRFHPGMVGTVIVSALTLTQTGHVTAGRSAA